MQDYPQPHTTTARRRRPWVGRLILMTITLVVLVNLVAALMVAAYQVYYDGLIFPGVTAWGVDLSGMSPIQAQSALLNRFNYPQTATYTFVDGDQSWQATTQDMGIQFDVVRTVQEAYNVGRGPGLFTSLQEQATAWRRGITVAPIIVFDSSKAETFLRNIAAQIDHPAVDATVIINGLEVTTTPSEIGRTVDVAATVAQLAYPVSQLQSATLPLVIIETPPAIADATQAAETIRVILDKDMMFYVAEPYPGDPGPWTLSRDDLAAMLVIEPVALDIGGSEYRIRVSESQLQAFLDPLAPQLTADPEDGRFIFNDETRELEVLASSRDGRLLDIPATIALTNQMAPTADHQVPLVFQTVAPEISSAATGEELGITELISSATTYFAGSSSVRVTNIQAAASRFHGLVVLPGEEFSFNHYLGDVSEETGYETGLIIFGGRTIEGVGGGVCQVSTTAFQAAFYAGFPVLERWPHGYRVGYYETGEGAGMDATVFAPLVDFQFVNDTPYHLLIETYTNTSNMTLTFRFYSTSDGRTVERDGPLITNVIEHEPPLYEENSELSPGQRRQVDYAVDGADVTVHRTVYRADGTILHQDTFFSHYLPWRAVYQVPPGEIPPGAARVGEEESG